jgi:hypothetical protein
METLLNLDFILIAKYILCAIIVISIILVPAWLARQNGKEKYDMMMIRMASWVLGWTGIGWLLALIWGVRK